MPRSTLEKVAKPELRKILGETVQPNGTLP